MLSLNIKAEIAKIIPKRENNTPLNIIPWGRIFLNLIKYPINIPYGTLEGMTSKYFYECPYISLK